MAVTQLPEAKVAALNVMPFTYDAAGHTAGDFPPGFAALHRVRLLPPDVDFETAAGQLMSWQMHAAAGLHVAVSSATVAEGSIVVLGLGLPALHLSAPCRVAYVVDEPGRLGFAYGTLPGHPESGKERFVLQRRADGRIELAIDAFSRPNTIVARLAGPVGRWMQRQITDRYLHALDT